MSLLSISKAAKLYDVSRPTLQKSLKNGVITGKKVKAGGSESWQIDTAELARAYKLRTPDHGNIAMDSDAVGQQLAMEKNKNNDDLSGEVVRGLEDQLQVIRQELAAVLAVSEERRRLLDDMVKLLPRPEDEEPNRPKRGLWDRLRGR